MGWRWEARFDVCRGRPLHLGRSVVARNGRDQGHASRRRDRAGEAYCKARMRGMTLEAAMSRALAAYDQLVETNMLDVEDHLRKNMSEDECEVALAALRA